MAVFFVPVSINLTPDQLKRAEAEAQRRQSVNEAKGLKGRNRAVANGPEALELHRLGCVGELAVATYLGLEDYVFSAQEAVRGSCDLPGGVEVKTRSKHNYDLLVQLDDDPSKVFVLVTHERGGITQIVGWAMGYDVMRKEYIRELVRGRPCYVVPQKVLQPCETLAEIGLVQSKNRILGKYEAWTTQCDNGDVLLHFSHDLLAELGWRPGDTLTWSVDPVKCQFILTKTVERNPQSTDLEP